MRSLTVRAALGAIAITAALGSAGIAAAAPSGPCRDVPYVGVCERLGDQPRPTPRQSMGEIIVTPDSTQSVG
ncbi:hypothetical protein H7I53_21185 [Mycolicibacterium pulveris]|uniref:Uncharacterized protein n=1 Tax=Mycolicibacterium pulveris TaxID=36813 RepID=A0A7I7UHK7_MYCPV|nr:hypothetical protein [Mycolicibacterium pulveris]MCV6982727.1 hypothetical protein [Mycolicibacterium pulveris]BBY80343.1 hypothetical protein MPUL_15010 [Mycolicibacterium pulveris]